MWWLVAGIGLRGVAIVAETAGAADVLVAGADAVAGVVGVPVVGAAVDGTEAAGDDTRAFATD
jgi:hypothetical protein